MNNRPGAAAVLGLRDTRVGEDIGTVVERGRIHMTGRDAGIDGGRVDPGRKSTEDEREHINVTTGKRIQSLEAEDQRERKIRDSDEPETEVRKVRKRRKKMDAIDRLFEDI